MGVLSKNSIDESEHKTVKNYRHLQIVSIVRKMLVNCKLTWSDSYDKKFEAMKRFGYDNYSEYLGTSYWSDVKRQYKESCLLQRCMVCKDNQILLHHTDYSCVHMERLDLFLPLCDAHHKLLHLFLAEYNLPMEVSHEAIRFVISRNLDSSLFNRQMYQFRKCIVEYKANQMGVCVDISSYRIGQKRSNKKDIKIIKFTGNNCSGVVFYRVNTGDVQVGINGSVWSFDELRNNFSDCMTFVMRNNK